jgi:hypothetical protein
MMENVTALEAAKKLKEMFALSTSKPSSIDNQLLIKPDAIVNPPLAFALKNLDPTHPFIDERGIKLETAREFGIAFHSGKVSIRTEFAFRYTRMARSSAMQGGA